MLERMRLPFLMSHEVAVNTDPGSHLDLPEVST